MNFVAEELADRFDDNDLFGQVSHIEGEDYRKIARRRTVKFTHNGNNYFAKIHFGVGWIEILKNLFQGRLPVLGARNEWEALHLLDSISVHSMEPVLFCETGFNPASRRSCVITKSLENTISLEDLIKASKPEPVMKRYLINELAQIARRMHSNGINHRDFYLCHFLMDQETHTLFLIDLHRAQIRKKTPDRWQTKDLGGLLFSSFDAGLTRRDLIRFVKAYIGDDTWRDSLRSDVGFWNKVKARAIKLYLQDFDTLRPDIAALLEVE